MKPQDRQALMFTDIVKEVIESFGAGGEEAVAEGVRRYGRRRGKRMADRAKQNGFTNDLLGYILFGEFDVDEIGNVLKIISRKPFLHARMTSCFWCTIWTEYRVLDYGKLYCKDIDTAILDGFNKDSGFEVDGNMTAGAENCNFYYHNWPMTLGSLFIFIMNKKKAQKKALKSWDFHAADLFQALSSAISEQLGPDSTQAVDRGLAVFRNRFGPKITDRILTMAKETDFDIP